ncbi:MAG: putative sugar O-methyltransferase [Solirubrobacteraceae bacterium]
MSLTSRLFGEPAQRTPLSHALVSAGSRVGVTPYNWRLLKSTRHRELHLRSCGVAHQPIEERPPHPVGDADVALCERLVDAYGAARSHGAGEDQVGGVWSWIYEHHQRGLARTLDARDAPALALALASMFRRPFVHGLAAGALLDHSRSRLGARIWRVKSLDGLISLAEALGELAVQGAERGRGNPALDDGLGELVERVEARLGYSIDFPDVGAAPGTLVHGRLLTIDSAEQIYAAARVEQALRAHLPDASRAPRIVEIGGGYGAMAYWFLRGASDPSRYTIVDLPIVCVLQGYFLSKALGEPQVSLFGEDPARVAIVPTTALDDVQTPYDVLVNKDSMPEMPAAAALAYLAWARGTCDGIFFSCNHESAREYLGDELGIVARLVEQAGGFVRLRRDRSWVRPGYIEEIYAPAAA